MVQDEWLPAGVPFNSPPPTKKKRRKQFVTTTSLKMPLNLTPKSWLPNSLLYSLRVLVPERRAQAHPSQASYALSTRPKKALGSKDSVGDWLSQGGGGPFGVSL